MHSREPLNASTTFLHTVGEGQTVCRRHALDEQQGLRRIRSMQQQASHTLTPDDARVFSSLLPTSLSVHTAFDCCPTPHRAQGDRAAHRKRAACRSRGANRHPSPTLAPTISSVPRADWQTSSRATAASSRHARLLNTATATTQCSLDAHESVDTAQPNNDSPLFYTSSLRFDP